MGWTSIEAETKQKGRRQSFMWSIDTQEHTMNNQPATNGPPLRILQVPNWYLYVRQELQALPEWLLTTTVQTYQACVIRRKDVLWVMPHSPNGPPPHCTPHARATIVPILWASGRNMKLHHERITDTKTVTANLDLQPYIMINLPPIRHSTNSKPPFVGYPWTRKIIALTILNRSSKPAVPPGLLQYHHYQSAHKRQS